MPKLLEKLKGNKPVLYGTLGIAAIAGVVWYRHKSAAATTAATDTSNIDPATGLPYGSPEDQAAIDQMQSGGFVGDPFGGGSFGSGGNFDSSGGSTGSTGPDLSTKEAWVAEAENRLPNGHSAEVRNGLLGVLGGLTVTSDERRIFLEAAGLLGDPPGGYPKPIRVKDTPGHPHHDVKVPNVVGEHQQMAFAKIHAAGLNPKAAPGLKVVHSEDPHAGAQVAKGSTVVLS